MPINYDWHVNRLKAEKVYKEIESLCKGKWTWKFNDQNQDASYCFSISSFEYKMGAETIVFSNFGEFVYIWEEQLTEEVVKQVKEILKKYNYEIVSKKEQEKLEELGSWEEVQYRLFSYL